MNLLQVFLLFLLVQASFGDNFSKDLVTFQDFAGAQAYTLQNAKKRSPRIDQCSMCRKIVTGLTATVDAGISLPSVRYLISV
jgi:hypothetical protein